MTPTAPSARASPARSPRAHGDHGFGGELRLELDGSAGQSLGAFLPDGVVIDLSGEANDYVGKGMAGGEIVLRPPAAAASAAATQVIAGNTCLYGATGGRLFAAGRVGERFAVRNSRGRGRGRGRRRPLLRVHDRRRGSRCSARWAATPAPA